MRPRPSQVYTGISHQYFRAWWKSYSDLYTIVDFRAPLPYESYISGSDERYGSYTSPGRLGFDISSSASPAGGPRLIVKPT